MCIILKTFLLKHVFSTRFAFLPLRKFSSKLIQILSKMPKEPSHTAELKNQRIKLKEKSKKYAPGTVSIKILGTGARGSTRALYVFTDQTRYMFNCGEGTQRLAHEHKMKLTKLEHIFVTHKSWENIGGLLGLSLTIQDAGVPEMQLHGPPGTDEIFQATRRFVVMKDLAVNMKNCLAEKSYEDNIMTVKYVPVLHNKKNIKDKSAISEPELSDTINGNSSVKDQLDCTTSKKIIEDDDEVDYYAYERKRSKKFSRAQDRKRFCASFSKESLQKEESSHVAMSYICRLKPRSGALNLEKCVEKGVPPGPLLGILKSGGDVELEDGTIVMSQEVCDPDEPGAVFLVVECPSLEYIDSFVMNKDLQMHQAAATRNEDFAYLVVHFTPQSVMDDLRYKNWMDAFSFSTCHIVLNDNSKCSGSVAVHRIQHKLNILQPQIFPLLKDSGILLESEMANVETNSSSLPIVQGRTLYSVSLRPRKSLSCEDALKFDAKEYVNDTMCVEGFPEVLSDLKEKLKYHPITNQEYPRILFLGTGSCVPNKIRNTSSIILEISESELLMMDCGEGTLVQMTRFYGQENVDAVLCKLKGIYISHLHADHHLGLVGLIKGRRNAMLNKGQKYTPLFLMAPHQIMTWLNFYHRNFEAICHEFHLVPNSTMLMDSKKPNGSVLEELKSSLGMTDISTVLVNHCPNAFGVAFRHNSGWKITYSGDTMPSAALVNLGKNTDLLIHEATMEDELEDEAQIKMHSTTSQAIKVGQEMGAKFTLLTHFSQRYAKLPRFNDNFSSSVGIAFDNMLISLKDLHVLPLLYNSLKIMFADDYEELEQRALRRQRRLKADSKV